MNRQVKHNYAKETSIRKSILPLYTATQVLNRRRSNIDKMLAKIEDASNSKADLAADEALILRGPQSGQIGVYKDALERLNTSIAFNASDLDLRTAARLVETGAKKLTQLYTKVMAEGSSGPTPTPESKMMMMSFPSSLIQTLTPVVFFLRTLPLPSTHPSHPAASAILSTLKEAQKGYADMRGNWSVKCLEGQGKRLVTRAETTDSLTTGREFTEWVELILGTSEEEYKLLKELSPLSGLQMVASAYGTLMAPILKLFNLKSLHKYNFLALDRTMPKIRTGLRKDGALCLRSFPEFLANLKLGAMARGSDTGTKLIDFTISTVKYIEKIPRVQTAIESALLALGDGNWKMGEGIQVGKGVKTDEVDHSNIIEHFVHDVILTAINSLVTLSHTSRRPTFGSIFLLNNISYLWLHLLESSDPNLFTFVPKPAEEALNSKFRIAKAR
ncbi:hypothetical protein BYT27DRAFT_7276127 [Phlegmacium glaucopus]|nr:hypothetical protein BYT27DRAFT_7276127 [Phlegmacium glaucopus]